MAYPVLTANNPVAGQISWTAFSIAYKGVTYVVAAGSTASAWVAWLYNGGAPAVVTNNTKPTASSTTNGTLAGWSGSSPSIGPDDLLLFGNRAGVPLDVQRTQIITGDLIATGTIVSNNIATNAITATNIAANTITAAQIAANTITAAQIAASTITGTQIAGNTITGDKIQAGSITAASLTIGNLRGNLVLNANFEDTDPSTSASLVWRNNFLGGTGVASNTKIQGVGTVVDGANSGYLSGVADLTSNSFPVSPGQTYYVAAVVNVTTSVTVNLVVTFGTTQNFNNGTRIGNVPTVSNPQIIDTSGTITIPATSVGGGIAYVVNNASSGTPGVAHTLSGQVKVPTLATWAAVSINTTTGSLTVDNVQCNAVVISAYIANGAIDGKTIRTDPTGTAAQWVQMNASSHSFEVVQSGFVFGRVTSEASAYDNISIQSDTAKLTLWGGGGGGAELNAGAGYLKLVGSIQNGLFPSATNTYDLGGTSQRWNTLWCTNAAGTGTSNFSGGYVMITSAHTTTNDWNTTVPALGGGGTTYYIDYVDGTPVNAIAGSTRLNSGTKTFVIDHPADKDSYLVHAAVEGPENAVFYRGRARLKDGHAVVQLPTYFTALCDETSATVHLTPVADIHRCGHEANSAACYPSEEACNGHTEVANLVVSTVIDGEFEVGRASGFTEGEADQTVFNWLVMATRKDVSVLEVEPSKGAYTLQGDGPYTYLVKE